MTATTIDRTGPDGGYIIHDHGYYAEAEEYIRADDLDPNFVKACGGPAPFTAGYIRLNRSLALEHRSLSEYRRAIDSAGWASAQRRYVSGDPSITYQSVRPLRRAEIIEAMLNYGYGDYDNTGEWIAEVAPKCLFDGQITAGYGCGKPHGHMDECEAAIPSDAYQQWANTQA